jgi:uncharacterized protein YecE (DUF72 family)
MELFVGTSGYNYKEWKGPFYPEKLVAADMLEYYAGQFRSVEINNTFYRVPKPEVVRGWAESVPEGFQFVLKATRRITHIKRLKEVGEEVDYFVGIATEMRDRLGALLFQFPPTFKKEMERLSAFLEHLPERLPVACEFRHDSWFDDEVRERLAQRNVALCFAHEDDDTQEQVEQRFAATADWGYLRLRGTHYSDEEMQAWVQRVQHQDWQRTFVFFKHEDEGLGPKLAHAFLDATGSP